jgi:micrococcal nuclease
MNSKTGKKDVIATPPSRSLILVVLLVAFLTIANIAIAFTQPKEQINGELWIINRVVSGQTVEATVVNNPNMTVQRVRLLGLSAPLKEQSPWGDRARI